MWELGNKTGGWVRTENKAIGCTSLVEPDSHLLFV